MPAPTSSAEFMELIQKSGVVEPARLHAHFEQLRERRLLTEDLKELAAQLVRDSMITYFQAEQFLLGKWKRFTIGKYRVLERLGVGGMGQVFLCEHRHMRRRVAVKVLPTAKAEDPAALERFYREARAVAALDHPNLVRAYDIDQDETLHFLVMEYVDGLSLQEIVRRTGPMDPIRACHYVAQSADGLQYANEVAGLIHRDVKPGNVLVDRSGLVKLLDMGLARFFNDEDDILTKKYDETVLGTADYLAPEQAIDSHGVDVRADIYSLGATFYFLLTGRPPFADGTIAQKLIWHQTRQPDQVRKIRPDVPQAIAAILERMMMKEPSAQYQTPTDVAAALAAYTQVPIPPPTDQELPRLSPAAMISGSGSSTAPSGRYAIPRTPSPSQRAPAPITAFRTPPPAPAGREPKSSRASLAPPKPRTPAPAAPAASAPATKPAGKSAVKPATKSGVRSAVKPVARPTGKPAVRDDSNPFAVLLTSPNASPSDRSDHNVYATATTRAAGFRIPNGQANAPEIDRSKGMLVMTGTVLAILVGLAFWALVF